ncbi:MAG: ethyl tert-butyl ether degradation protein EthD [Algoriphagus sp.]|nr:ethyl tert-butyl ether degradation protein EthD [Algoriphagus sp.]
MVKIVIVYGHPKDAEEFEKYYSDTHMHLARKISCQRLETCKFIGTPDGKKPSNYRMAELYFSTMEDLQTAMASDEGKEAVQDIPNFATGGVEVSIAEIS